MYGPHCGHGQEAYKNYLKELKSKLNGLNKRRLVLICGDLNAQVSRKELNKEGKLGLSHRTNTNSKLPAELLKEKDLSIVNHLTVPGKKGSKKHATFMPRSESGGHPKLTIIFRKATKPTTSNEFVDGKPNTTLPNSNTCTGSLEQHKHTSSKGRRSQKMHQNPKNNKAPGPDNLRNEVLKHVEIVQKHAVREIQSFFRLDAFKSRKMRKICRGKVVYLYKQKGSKNDPSNYRPISLLNSHFKLLTKIINNRITPILNKVLDYQAGFRNNRSTMQKIEAVHTIIKETLKRKIYLRFLFIDFAKAFDSISHKFMKLALEEHHVPKKLTKLITTLYDKIKVFVSDSGEKSSLVNIKRGVLQGDSLSPSIFILCHDSIMKRIKKNTLQGTSLHNQTSRYFAFADDLVILTRNDEEIISFVTQLQNLQQLTGLKINASKTKVMLTNEGYNLVDKIPDVDINRILTNFHCERCDRYFHSETSLRCHKSSRFCDGTRNRSRAGTLAVTDSRTIIHDKIQPKTNNVEVAGETSESVTRYKYLGAIFDPQGIDADAISKKLNEVHNHIKDYNFQLEEGDLDLANIVKKRQENHRSTVKDIIDKELTALRENQLQNPSPPPRAKPIYYYEALALLGEEPVPPEDPPPSHFTHHPENENQPSNCTRNQELEEYLDRNQHFNRSTSLDTSMNTSMNTNLDLNRNANLDLDMNMNHDMNRTPIAPILRLRYNIHNQPTENSTTRISPKALSETSRITAGGR
eukprot:augustus_masked-scaffold_2-processed-gene-5.50-mRNA-1 protein AED:1.00 eAED:1.00 QI:0/0/0/0/1/1/3/0/748